MVLVKIDKLPIKYGKSAIVQIGYKGEFTRDQVIKITQEVSDDLKQKGANGQLMTTLVYNKGPRSGQFTKFGEPVNTFVAIDYYIPNGKDHVDVQESFKSFYIYVMKDAPTAGGCSGLMNDCLYDCLRLMVSPFDMPWKHPEELKSFLKLERTDPIDVKYIKQIEEQLPKYAINVTGDHIYSSMKKTNYRINIKLNSGHYKLRDKYQTIYGVTYSEKEPVIYDTDKDTGNIILYNGKYKNMSYEDFKIIHNDFNSPYIFISMDDYSPLDLDLDLKKHEKMEMSDVYKQFIKDADILKSETKGLINLYKTGSNRKTSRYLFNTLTSSIQTDDIEQDEAIYLNNISTGPLIYAQKYEGPGYEYDYKSMYPSIMKNQHFYVPLKRGEFKLLTQAEFLKLPYYSYGIYRVEIERIDTMLFRYNCKNYYTQIDLTEAKHLGLKMKIIEDGKPNFLFYDRSGMIEGNKLFAEYVDILYKLKEKGIRKAKSILNCLWGALCQKDELKLVFQKKGPEIDLKEDRTITEMYPLNSKDEMIKFVKNDKYYATNFARMKPFLLAKGRKMIADTIEPFIIDVKRLHTDGFVVSKKLNIKTGDKIGDLTYKGYCENIKVKNCNEVIGDFIKEPSLSKGQLTSTFDGSLFD
jgi:hypothetical protein